MKRRMVWQPIIIHNVLLGAVFGLLFPVIGTFFQILIDRLPVNIPSIILAQQSQPLLWIIDSTPIILGIISGVVGLRQYKLTN